MAQPVPLRSLEPTNVTVCCAKEAGSAAHRLARELQ
jgi:hypothetical protein